MRRYCCRVLGTVGLIMVSSTLGHAAAFAQSRPSQPSAVSLTIRAAMVGEDLTVRPIPQTSFLVIRTPGDTSRVETDLAGTISGMLRPGSYRIERVEPVLRPRNPWLALYTNRQRTPTA
jgi:hypothetical protein